MLYILFVGHGKDNIFYEKLDKKLGSNISLSWFDNKLEEGVALGKKFSCSNSNRLYEFSGYECLIENFIKYKNFDNFNKESVICILNDTSVDHHSFFIWKKIVKKLNYDQLLNKIFVDMRSAKNLYGSYKYAASWLYVIQSESLSNFLQCLKETLKTGTSNHKYYMTDSIETFGEHLDDIKRKRLQNWLFSNKRYRGWQYSTDFKKMDPITRSRKGICIEMETLLSQNLENYGFKIVNLKSSLIGFFASITDRMITLLIKIKK